MADTHPTTPTILKWFGEINQIPRGSKNEEQISNWLASWAHAQGFEAQQDAAMNVVIRVPGTEGYESSPAVVLQGHMDMVCEKAKGSPHDFTKDPIKIIEDDGWLRADHTTLGADNGIALAMAMTVASEAGFPHPPLELLFTVDEETGLTGANEIQPGFISGKILLNIDSEDEGVFTIGCAGGRDTKATFPIERGGMPAGHRVCQLVVEGLRGGHSGVDIHEQRGNSIKTLARALDGLLAGGPMCLISIHAGTAHNAIPRDAEALLTLPEERVAAARAELGQLDTALKAELARIDPAVAVTLEQADGGDGQAWTEACTRRAVDLMLGWPHGVDAFSVDMEGLVETSNNLASIRTVDDTLEFLSSQRSSIMDRLHFLTHRIEGVARLAGAAVHSEMGYPSWEPDVDSALLDRCKRIYKGLYDKDPVVEVIHAGLECGIIGSKYEGMDMISFGPTITGPHSPEERIEIKTIGMVWDFLAALLKDLK